MTDDLIQRDEKQEYWEKDVDNKLRLDLKLCFTSDYQEDAAIESIKDFIRSEIKQAEQRERERVIEEVKEHIRNWDYQKVDNLHKWIDQLKQKTKE